MSTSAPPSADAEAILGQARAHHQAGRFADAEALYRRILEHSPEDAPTLSKLAAAVAGQGRLADAAALLDRAIGIDPGLVEALSNLGLVRMMQGRAEAAFAAFDAALAAEPDHVSALNGLGAALLALGRSEDAAAALIRLLEIEPENADALTNLGIAERGRGNLDAALDAFERTLRLRPDMVAAHVNRGNVLRMLGRLEDAAGALSLALHLAPDHAEAHWNLAHVLLMQGDFARGWAEYEWRWKCAEFEGRVPHFPVPAWDGGRLDGRTLLVHCEQGFGDNLQFARFVAAAVEVGGPVILHCPEPLARLFEGLAGGIEIVSGADPVPSFDVHASLMSLPHLLGVTEDGLPGPVPYLDTDSQSPLTVAGGDGPAVGIVWSGNPGKKISAATSVALERFRPLLDVPGVRFASLQVGNARDEIATLGLDGRLADLGGGFTDFADTAATIKSLDLVITVDTAVAHLAGALGRPVWTLLSHVPDWRWMLERADSPWYPSMRLFRQRTRGDWDGVFADVGHALRDFA